jgi:hypothetical protein
MTCHKEKLLENIREKVDPDELIDVLGLDIDDLVDRLYDDIMEQEDKFEYLEEE